MIKKGFTLIELLVVIGLSSILVTLATINLIRPQNKATLDAATTTLVTDIKNQQSKSMTGSLGGLTIQSTSYTLTPDNFTVNLDSNITFSTTLPSGQISFTRRSGEVVGFINGQNTITVHESGGNQKIITINKLGVISIQ